jgi:hypothetical protein
MKQTSQTLLDITNEVETVMCLCMVFIVNMEKIIFEKKVLIESGRWKPFFKSDMKLHSAIFFCLASHLNFKSFSPLLFNISNR